MVVSFVGFVGGYLKAVFGPDSLFLAGAVAASLVTWFTFLPSFVFILLGGPLVETTHNQLKFTAPLTAITAAVVGVILNLAVWFALHVFFAQVTKSTLGPVTLWQPQVSSLEWPLVVLATVSGYLLLWRHWSIPAVLGVAATASLLWRLAA